VTVPLGRTRLVGWVIIVTLIVLVGLGLFLLVAWASASAQTFPCIPPACAGQTPTPTDGTPPPEPPAPNWAVNAAWAATVAIGSLFALLAVLKLALSPEAFERLTSWCCRKRRGAT